MVHANASALSRTVVPGIVPISDVPEKEMAGALSPAFRSITISVPAGIWYAQPARTVALWRATPSRTSASAVIVMLAPDGARTVTACGGESRTVESAAGPGLRAVKTE